jgi:hypothetical protein
MPKSIIDKARSVSNGDRIIIEYLKPADVMQTRTFERTALEELISLKHRKGSKTYERILKNGKKLLPKMNEGGRNPIIKLYKISTYELIYDERDYFQQMLFEQAQNLYPTKKESDFRKIEGILYEKSDDSSKLYIRFAIREDQIDTKSMYSSDKAGKSVKKYEDIEQYLNVSARRDYKCYNRQMGMTATGSPPKVKILQINFDVERILSIKVVKAEEKIA